MKSSDIVEQVKQRLATIQKQINTACEMSQRNPEDITIIAVTKQVSPSRAQSLLDIGIKDLGENRLEGLLEKQEAITDSANWHFIGNLQTRKVKDLIDTIDCLHSLDRLSLAKEVNKRASRPLDCFVQVNVSGEESKSGITPEEADVFFEQLAVYENVHVIGLMTMAPNTEDESVLRGVFQSLRELRDRIAAKKLPYAPCTKLSMGMSNDFAIAIEEGATHIRIGTALAGSEREEIE
ncbi:YggS family pyridoxal phosphate enzyme [Sporosarcina sp. P37]|uniref:YggS family pyridoxal phosphate-dependent enzyme n=1 Tax=unclassified Sporosarcina TaxID=2647733 RepID=UPI0009BDB367|nr:MULTISPECIES: YggS family pyridoxal phosphate-dependent enzyme [unclassified Sporosarcina]ARD49227.1 YggS family pyridoxal phosphate enzyme [Sporosarcina sp. P33]ARK25703.1 YggS family pyridoxal phosphate enzyme [Sporosarcina sp. P37]PID19275.1 YggS family pyridoxal phosphate-dependent enzyme [Sporosarcina sp. P35]